MSAMLFPHIFPLMTSLPTIANWTKSVRGSGGGDIEEACTYHGSCSGERRPESAQKIRECAAPRLHLAARRHRPARWSPTPSLIGAGTLPGCPRHGTHAALDPGRTDCWRRIVPGRPYHASRYSACLPPSCAPPWSATARPEAGRAKTCTMVQMELTGVRG
jgi:hypothetical protein